MREETSSCTTGARDACRSGTNKRYDDGDNEDNKRRVLIWPMTSWRTARLRASDERMRDRETKKEIERGRENERVNQTGESEEREK